MPTPYSRISALRVSAHALIRRDGEIVQYVPFQRRAWHAGESAGRGVRAATISRSASSSRGPIRLPYESVQYTAAARPIAELCHAYPALMPADRRPQRHRPGPQDRSWHGLRLAADARAGPLRTGGRPGMNLLALLFALACERGLTHLLHLRELRWLDRYCDWVGARLARQRARAGPWRARGRCSRSCRWRCFRVPRVAAAWPPAVRVRRVPAVVLVRAARSQGRSGRLRLGAQRGDRRAAASSARELLENDAAGRGAGAREAVDEAIFVQANNRIFGVIFWFLVLGAPGAWLFRVSDLLRRRAAFEAMRAGVAVSGRPTAGRSLSCTACWRGCLRD